MIFLMYNMGNSGGSWFERVCNTRKDVNAWEELHRQKEYVKIDMADADQYALDFLKVQSQHVKCVGLIKSFGKKTVEYCKAVDGVITQMYRNPIKVINHKMGKKTDGCKKLGIDCSDIFEAHIKFYRIRYELFQSQSKEYITFRLEDVNSIHDDIQKFREFLEITTGIEWSGDEVRNAQKVMPYGKTSFADDGLEKIIWGGWDKRQRRMFLENFEHIMSIGGYPIP